MSGLLGWWDGGALTWRTLAGLSLTRLSKTLRAPDMDRETIASPPVQVLPTC